MWPQAGVGQEQGEEWGPWRCDSLTFRRSSWAGGPAELPMANVSGHGRKNIAEQLTGNAQRSFFRTDLQESL